MALPLPDILTENQQKFKKNTCFFQKKVL